MKRRYQIKHDGIVTTVTKKKPNDIMILGIGGNNDKIDKDFKAETKADQQRWGKSHKDKMKARNMKLKQGGR